LGTQFFQNFLPHKIGTLPKTKHCHAFMTSLKKPSFHLFTLLLPSFRPFPSEEAWKTCLFEFIFC
jgi:hypothetical protein